jgi:hypothetical protein
MKQAGPCGGPILDVFIGRSDDVETGRDDLHSSTDSHIPLQCLELGSRDHEHVAGNVLKSQAEAGREDFVSI